VVGYKDVGEAPVINVGDQLEMTLFPGEPWEGRSPRGLTRVGLGLIFKALAVESASDYVDPLQLDLFPRRRQRTIYSGSAGAPTLLPLPF